MSRTRISKPRASRLSSLQPTSRGGCAWRTLSIPRATSGQSAHSSRRLIVGGFVSSCTGFQPIISTLADPPMLIRGAQPSTVRCSPVFIRLQTWLSKWGSERKSKRRHCALPVTATPPARPKCVLYSSAPGTSTAPSGSNDSSSEPHLARAYGLPRTCCTD